MSGVHVLVDGANLRGTLQRLGDARIDADLLVTWARGFDTAGAGTTVEWFQASYPNMGTFYGHLRAAGIRVITRRPKMLPDGSRKANMDVEIAMAATTAALTADTLVLLSGDGDFIPLVKSLSRQGKRVLVVSGSDEMDQRYRAAVPEPDLLLLEHELEWFCLAPFLRRVS